MPAQSRAADSSSTEQQAPQGSHQEVTGQASSDSSAASGSSAAANLQAHSKGDSESSSASFPTAEQGLGKTSPRDSASEVPSGAARQQDQPDSLEVLLPAQSRLHPLQAGSDGKAASAASNGQAKDQERSSTSSLTANLPTKSSNGPPEAAGDKADALKQRVVLRLEIITKRQGKVHA